MKTAADPRHIKRVKIVKNLFSLEFGGKTKVAEDKYNQIINNLVIIDKAIAQAAPDWPLEQINKIDLAILRLAIYEMTFEKKEPEKVIIDEAVEIAKSYGSEKSPKFVNGVLGTILKKISVLKTKPTNN